MRTRRLSLVACLAVCLLVSMAQGASASGATVTQNNYFFSPSTVTVTTGSSLLIHNATPSTPHTFTISGQGIDTLTNGGQSASIVINLSPGTYPFFCLKGSETPIRLQSSVVLLRIESARAAARNRYVHSSANLRESAKTTWISG